MKLEDSARVRKCSASRGESAVVHQSHETRLSRMKRPQQSRALWISPSKVEFCGTSHHEIASNRRSKKGKSRDPWKRAPSKIDITIPFAAIGSLAINRHRLWAAKLPSPGQSYVQLQRSFRLPWCLIVERHYHD